MTHKRLRKAQKAYRGASEYDLAEADAMDSPQNRREARRERRKAKKKRHKAQRRIDKCFIDSWEEEEDW